eukprot:349990-Chlamydomonas_euryale.AAC.20
MAMHKMRIAMPHLHGDAHNAHRHAAPRHDVHTCMLRSMCAWGGGVEGQTAPHKPSTGLAPDKRVEP